MIEHTQQTTRAVTNVAVGAGLSLTHWWSQLLTDVSFVASFIATISGAIIGMVGVWNIFKRSNK